MRASGGPVSIPTNLPIVYSVSRHVAGAPPRILVTPLLPPPTSPATGRIVVGVIERARRGPRVADRSDRPRRDGVINMSRRGAIGVIRGPGAACLQRRGARSSAGKSPVRSHRPRGLIVVRARRVRRDEAKVARMQTGPSEREKRRAHGPDAAGRAPSELRPARTRWIDDYCPLREAGRLPARRP